MAKLAIKSDNQNQIMLFPPSLDELIPSNHVVRIVSTVIDRLDISEIMSTYKGGGNSCFDPRMMLKVLIFAYLNNIYSSRKIERMLAENICYMWLLGMIRPDYRTIKKYDGRIKHNTLDIIEQIEKNHTIECEEETSAGEMTVSNQHSQSILNPILNSILKFCQSTKKK